MPKDFDIAVLLEKAIILNKLIATGTITEKRKARVEMEKVAQSIRHILNVSNDNNVGQLPFL